MQPTLFPQVLQEVRKVDIVIQHLRLRAAVRHADVDHRAREQFAVHEPACHTSHHTQPQCTQRALQQSVTV